MKLFKSYRCRDCGEVSILAKPSSRCPACGSIYLLPTDMRPPRISGKVKITLSERFLSLIFGAFFGFLTFFIWGVVLLVKGGPAAGKVAGAAFYMGLKFSIAPSLAVGIAGFIFGHSVIL
jgi:DNA-directed RNA polymerase subunit RPC12/RpoP